MSPRFHSIDEAIGYYTRHETDHDMWIGPVRNSLPYVTVNYTPCSVSRYIYCKVNGLKDEPYDMVWNTCGVLYCVKPEHLAIHTNAKTDADEIRKQYHKVNARHGNGEELAKKYGVSRQRIHQIVRSGR